MNDILFGIGAIILGIAASWGLYWVLDFLVRLLPAKTQERLRAFSFLLPALVLLILISVIPFFQTIVWSFFDKKGKEFIGVENYVTLFTDNNFLGILLNNFLWVAFVPVITVGFGLIAANLSNNVGPRREKIMKSLIFMPMSISFVSAATIWAYFYESPPPGRPQIGLLNAIVEAFGGEAQSWLLMDAGRLNSFFLMIVVVWLNAGFSMVMLSSAIKAVPEETIEAARIDGAGPFKIFTGVIIPQIRGTIMSVFITTVIGVMKIFDIVLAMTGGNFNTSVLGYEYYRLFFVESNIGGSAAVVSILCILIAPLMWLQIRTAKFQEEIR
ncbi:sugar ABC transporter permease [Rhodoluna sp.]|jgi:alpha-glucoside transport system permease protein|uniref:carbohydrate ABC transporter permease n=1 Tax=Rhodoluna sp. TaxID=1969481 RepID=UPI0025F4509A|nr:sugar ABC transporter permease [Rhodoluna sp.]